MNNVLENYPQHTMQQCHGDLLIQELFIIGAVTKIFQTENQCTLIINR